MALQREAGLRRFHQYGPWALVGTVFVAAIAVEAVRHHIFSSIRALYFVVLIPSIILHEVSHGAVANHFGDDTAKNAGRLTLNPLKHIDPVGTILLPILLIVTTGTAFGWAKPVPVSYNKLRHPRNEAVLVGLAGPAVNLVIAFLAGVVLHFVTHGFPPSPDPSTWPIAEELLYLLGIANVIVAAFNLIPIPPLDGSAVVERLLPASMMPGYYRLRSYSMVLVLLLVFVAPGPLDWLLNEAQTIFQNAVF